MIDVSLHRNKNLNLENTLLQTNRWRYFTLWRIFVCHCLERGKETHCSRENKVGQSGWWRTRWGRQRWSWGWTQWRPGSRTSQNRLVKSKPAAQYKDCQLLLQRCHHEKGQETIQMATRHDSRLQHQQQITLPGEAAFHSEFKWRDVSFTVQLYCGHVLTRIIRSLVVIPLVLVS